MRSGLAAATALAGALLFVSSQAAQAAPAVNLKGAAALPSGMVDLVRSPGGGEGGFGGVGRGGGGGKGGFGGAGPRGGAMAGGPRGGGSAMRGGGGGGRSIAGGPRGGGKVMRGGGGRDFNRGRGKHGGDYAYRGGKGDYRRGHRYARYPYFWPGVVAGGAYAYGYADECGWLWRRAQATGSPYWWQRYEECRYYN